jgi:AraC-like DNA-binding protein
MGHAVSRADMPAVHGLQMIELAERWNVTPRELLKGLDITMEMLSDPSGRLSIAQVEALVERTCALTGEPGLGFYMGLQMRLSMHGYLGFATMMASTVREALELAVRYSPTRTTAIGFRLHETGKVGALVLEEHAPLGKAREVIILSMLVGLAQIARAITGQDAQGHADVAFDEPAYASRFAHLLAGRMRFSQAQHRLVFDRKVLDMPILMADRAAQRLAQEQCERELSALGYEGDIVMRVRAHLSKRGDGFHSLDEVARALHTSERTLKRKLAQRDSSFSALLDEARHERATLLLGSDELAIEEVAQKLGYTDAANFTRAFRRWTGVSPRAYRERETPRVKSKEPKF